MSLKYLCTTFIDSAYSYSKIKRLKSQLQRIEDSSQLLECWLALVFQLLPKITEVILIAHRIGSRSAHFNLISCSSFRILFCTFRDITCFVFTCDGHMLFPWLCLVVSWFSQVFFSVLFWLQYAGVSQKWRLQLNPCSTIAFVLRCIKNWTVSFHTLRVGLFSAWFWFLI